MFSSNSGNSRNQNKTARTRHRFERAWNSVLKINKWTKNVLFSDFWQKSDFLVVFKGKTFYFTSLDSWWHLWVCKKALIWEESFNSSHWLISFDVIFTSKDKKPITLKWKIDFWFHEKKFKKSFTTCYSLRLSGHKKLSMHFGHIWNKETSIGHYFWRFLTWNFRH